MITWHEELLFDFSEETTNHIFTEDSIFFDIETTGFSPARTSLYLIGCATRKGDLLHIDQFFAESPQEEDKVLYAFLQLLGEYHTILSFNGIGFDIPYLKSKCNSLSIEYDFDSHDYLDIYKELSQLKALLGLASLKQKSVELFLDIDRRDAYSGGELIDVYKAYTRHPSDEALELLRQHNYEDVLYMPKLLPALAYRDFFQHRPAVISLHANEYKGMDGHIGREIIFHIKLHNPVPKGISYRYDDCYLTFDLSDARLCVKLLDDELKYFYDNPKDYYYLPEEDYAILKTLAQGVDRNRRVPANRSNCYTKKHALFLPQYEELFSPSFRTQAKDKKSYFELSEDFISSNKLQTHYIQHLLKHMNLKNPKR